MQLFLDLDGTVIDSRERLHRLFGDLTQSDAIGFAEYWTLKRSMRSNAWILGNRLGYESTKINAFTAHWMDAIEAPEYLALDSPFPHTPSALTSLAERGDLTLVTARQNEASTVDQIARMGLSSYFSRIIVTRQARSKAEALRGLSVAARDVFVGDTGSDILAAREVGAVAVGVLSGFRDRASLEHYRADGLYDHLGAFAATHRWT